jgi:homeobox protein cut-like
MDTFAITEGIVPENNNQDGHDAEQASSEQQLPEEANKFQRAIAAWRSTSPSKTLSILKLKVADISTLLGIDLTTTVAKLDATASDIVAQQRDALIQRKDLAQKTKDFRKLDDASKLAEYKGLLKCPSYLDRNQIDLSS